MRRKTWRKHKFPACGQVRDVEGRLWDVRDARDTKHGFDLLFGSPVSGLGWGCGLPALIATQPLVDFWEANQTKRNGVIYDLPAGRTTLKRVRQRLGFRSWDDIAEFWQERIDDLEALSAREFAAQHNIRLQVVFARRTQHLGRRARQVGWWREAGPLEILRSDITLREMGEKLDISISQAFRLKDQARELLAA
jgi:hypothetical protein